MADIDSQRNRFYSRQRSPLRYERAPTTTRNDRANGQNAARDIYDNLDEITAPSPIENRLEDSGLENEREESLISKRDGRRGDKRSSADDYGNLNEVTAPSPVEDRLGQSSGLEEARDAASIPGTADAAPGHPQNNLTPFLEYHKSKPSPRRQRISRFATELYIISFLIFFSIFGVLARLGLQWLTFYPGTPSIFPVLWANFAGTLLMGFFSEDQRLFRHEWGPVHTSTFHNQNQQEKAIDESEAKVLHAKVKKTLPLYIGLTTGFCGSFTSFSSFIRDIFFALSNDLATPVNDPHPTTPTPGIMSTVPRNGGYSFMALCAVIIITIGLCYAALRVGAHIAIYTDRWIPTLPFHFFRRFIDPIMVFIAWGVWLGAVFMTIWPPDRPGGPQSKGSWANETWRGQALFACVFAPLGCLLRFYVSLKLNARIPSFPLGTFAVNMFGTAVLGMAYDLQHVHIGEAGVGGGRVGRQVLQGIMDGFCGALTTVSTWVLELGALKRGHAYIYGSVSVLAGLGILVAIMGSVRWSVGWTAATGVT